MTKAGGIRFSPMRRVAADDPAKAAGDVQALENPVGVTLRLVREHGQTSERREAVEHLARTSVERRMREETLVVELEKAGQVALDVKLHARSRQCAPDQQRRALTDHARDCIDLERPAAVLDDQRVRGVREIAPRVDERSVEIEDNKAQARNIPKSSRVRGLVESADGAGGIFDHTVAAAAVAAGRREGRSAEALAFADAVIEIVDRDVHEPNRR